MAQKTTLTLTGIYGPALSFTAKADATTTLWHSRGKMGLALLVYDQPGGQLLYDWTLDAKGVYFSDGEHGHEAMTATIDLGIDEIFRVWDGLTVPHVVLTCGAMRAWVGRIEDRDATTRGLRLGAMGYWRALSDYGPYTAFWSDASTARWRGLTELDISTAKPERFEADNNNRLFMAARLNESFVNTDLMAWGYRVPDDSVTEILACQFVYQMGRGSNWRARLLTRDSAWGSGSSQWSLTGSGAVQSGVQNLTFTGAAALTFELEATGSVTFTGSTGSDAFLKITKLRIAAATTNRVNTTIAAGVGSTGSQVRTPGSMANIYSGQYLWIGSGSTGEVVTVTAVSSTTFTATYTATHSAGVTVQAIVIYGSDIAADIISQTNSLNNEQLQDSTALVATMDRDLETEIYEDQQAQDVLNYLAAEGAEARYEVGVDAERRLYLRERGSQANVWYTEAVEMTLSATLDTLTNKVYAAYRTANGWAMRTAEASATGVPVSVYRRGVITASTTSDTLAQGVRDSYLAERGSMTPRVQVVTTGLRDAAGNEYPLWMLAPGDELVLDNLPPTLTTSVDKIRRFRVRAKEYDAERDELKPVPELELPGLDVMIVGPMIRQAKDEVKVDQPVRLALAATDRAG